MIRVIGIDGAAGSGKDTLADLLVERHGFVKIAFADPMKRFCMQVYGWSTRVLWGPSHLRNEPDMRYRRRGGGEGPEFLTPRYALQKLGTEWAQDCWRPTWVEVLYRTIRDLQEDASLGYSQSRGLAWYRQERWKDHLPIQIPKRPRIDIVVPDVRHRFEMGKLHELFGARTYRIKRDGEGLGGEAGQHSSERLRIGIPDSEFDGVVDNNGPLEDLIARADEIARVG